MKRITFSADEHLIDRARAAARAERTTLNDAFREWLKEFTGSADSAQPVRELMDRLRYVRSGRRWTREEMNER